MCVRIPFLSLFKVSWKNSGLVQRSCYRRIPDSSMLDLLDLARQENMPRLQVMTSIICLCQVGCKISCQPRFFHPEIKTQEFIERSFSNSSNYLRCSPVKQLSRAEVSFVSGRRVSFSCRALLSALFSPVCASPCLTPP